MRQSQRLQEKVTRYAEVGGIDADPETERQSDDEGEPGTSSNKANRLANVLDKGLHGVSVRAFFVPF